jgi:hypothetical protein
LFYFKNKQAKYVLKKSREKTQENLVLYGVIYSEDIKYCFVK